jgi:hypothetical protein
VGLAHYFNFFDAFSSGALKAISIWRPTRPLRVEARAHNFFEALLGRPSSSAGCFLYFLFSFFFLYFVFFTFLFLLHFLKFEHISIC